MHQGTKHQEGNIPLAGVGTAHQPASASVGAPSAVSEVKIDSEHATSSGSLDPVLFVKEANQTDPNSIIKLSRRRWLVLLTMSIFGICASISIGTAPILDLILQLLGLREDQFLYLRQIISYFSLVMSIPTAWYVDKYGIKRSISTAATLYALSSFLKAALYSYSLPGNRLLFWFVAGLIGAQAGSIYFMLPLKVAETWFSAKERSVAWTVMISTGDLGICVAALLYPRIMRTLPSIQILGYINIVAPIITSIVCLTCISADEPKHPPSERQARANKLKVVPLKTSMKRIITNKDVFLHLLHGAIFRASAMSIDSVLQKILTNAGYSTIFAGDLMSINAFVSIIMLIVMSSFVHKTENPILICKLSSAAVSVLQVVYIVFLMNQMPAWSLVLISIALTVCTSWSVPNATNITAHLAAELVSQAIIVAFSTTLGVLVSSVINVTFAALIKFHELEQRASNYTQSLTFIALVTGLNELIYQVFFHGQSKREETGEPEIN